MLHGKTLLMRCGAVAACPPDFRGLSKEFRTRAIPLSGVCETPRRAREYREIRQICGTGPLTIRTFGRAALDLPFVNMRRVTERNELVPNPGGPIPITAGV